MPNSYDLAGKSAIVTGGAQGIGRAISERLLASGAQVRIWDAQPAAVHGAHSSIVDVTRPDDIARGLAELPHDAGIDILVSDVGYLGLIHPFEQHAADDWLRIVGVNLLGTMQVTQALLPRLLRGTSARIVNIGSLAGKEGLPQLAAYLAAERRVIAFTKALARELVGRGILVNCVAPGPIDTGMIRALGDEVVARMIGESPMRRLGAPEEVAQLVAWLCSDASRFNSGAVFDMSGGRARY